MPTFGEAYMETQNNTQTSSEIYEKDYNKWDPVVIKSQLIIACCVFGIEVANNIILYVNRSQGYGPDTIFAKLIRYLLITTVINFGMVVLSMLVRKKVSGRIRCRFLLMFFTVVMCTDVSFSHYQFATTFAIFVLPIVISLLYEDWSLSVFTLICSLVGQFVAIISRAADPMYEADIAPEGIIAVCLLLSCFVFGRFVNETLVSRRNELKEAVIRAEQAHAESEKMVLSFKMLETLASTIDAKDKYTNGHSRRVAAYSTKLAEKLGWDEEQIDNLRIEALLHDIGKVSVPDVILNKPAKLSEMEFGLIKSHTVIGSDILKNMIAVPNASKVARHHHERYDGKGYPSGIKGEEIPINARIVCIADSYDAMSSDRIYRKALSHDVIREELIKGRGTQFDPNFLDAFLEMFDSGELTAKSNLDFMSDSEARENSVLKDIENVISQLSEIEGQKPPLVEFDKFYEYISTISMRYDRSIEVMTIDLKMEGAQDVFANIDEVSDVLQVAIRKNIRAADVYYRYSPVKHILILLDAGLENVDVIEQRILYDFNANESAKGYSIEFSLNESLKPQNPDLND